MSEEEKDNSSNPEVCEKALDTEDIDRRSIFVGNVDYSASTEELRDFFRECGDITRVTIPTDHFSKSPKAYAYIEFCDQAGVLKAQSFNDRLFKGRKLKVQPKRTNVPGHQGARGHSRRGYFYTSRRRSRRR